MLKETRKELKPIWDGIEIVEGAITRHILIFMLIGSLLWIIWICFYYIFYFFNKMLIRGLQWDYMLGIIGLTIIAFAPIYLSLWLIKKHNKKIKDKKKRMRKYEYEKY